MIDRCGRQIDYLRISVTDRCNLRCVYCMPEEGIRQVDRSLILQEEEILRVVQNMAELGITRIKLTGGEPLIRPGMAGMIRRIKNIDGIDKVTLTTNGILLKEQMKELSAAGVDGINISLDTLDAECFSEITRRNLLEETKQGICEALKYPSVQLKINCVPLGADGQDVCRLAELAQKYPIHVRFIEMMPIGRGKGYSGLSQQEIMEQLEKKFGTMTEYTGIPLGNGPCRYYMIDGFQGKIGFISAISHKFCGECNRVRLTSQGYLKTCLQYTAGRDLREILRSGGTDEELKCAIRDAVAEKPDGHHFREKAEADDTEKLCMSQIGG